MSFSVSSIKNWLLKDPLLDYLHLYGDKKDQDVFAFPESNFTNYIMNKGNQYEKQVYDYLEKNKGPFTMTIIDREKFYAQTRSAFQNQIDIICQPFLKDYDSCIFKHYKIYGFPDIVIKRKAFNYFFRPQEQLSTCEEDSYIAIDIKYSSFGNNFTSLQTNHSYQRYVECQILLYGTLLNLHCKQIVIHAYICPKQSIIQGKCLDVIRVNLYSQSTNLKECEIALEWLTYLKEKGRELKLDGKFPSMIELLPNLNNTMDYPWSGYKHKLAIQYGEVSLFSGIGETYRKAMHKKKHYSYKDIIEIDKLTEKTRVLINGYDIECKIVKNMNKDFSKRMYIDIETCFLFDSHKEIIVMICCGYLDNDGNIITKIIESGSQEQLVSDFFDFMIPFKDYVIVHYSSAENKLLKRFEASILSDDIHKQFITMYRNGEVSLKGLCGFSLKEIMKCLHQNGYIDSNPYDKCVIKSGIEVLSIYNQIHERQCEDKRKIYDAVDSYNRADVESLYLLDQFI